MTNSRFWNDIDEEMAGFGECTRIPSVADEYNLSRADRAFAPVGVDAGMLYPNALYTAPDFGYVMGERRETNMQVR